MIDYQKIKKDQASIWNEELLKTNASYFQYPYYCSGYEYMPNSSCDFYTITLQDVTIAFVSILNIKVGILKIGLIIRGPAVINENCEQEIIQGLRLIQKREGYFFLRVNPNNTDQKLERCLKENKTILAKDAFPIYKGAQDRDYIIKLESNEEKILASYKINARRKIKYAKEDKFIYSRIKTINEFKEVYDLLKSVSTTKGFKFRSQKSYEAILKEGLKYNLCDVYCAHYENKLVNAIIIMKDKSTTTHHSSGLIQHGYNLKNAPATYLHHQAIIDANAESKKYYNMSYSDESSPVYKFKILFNPIEIKFPKYYTIGFSKFLIQAFILLTTKLAPRIKKIVRKKYGNK